MKKLAVKKYLKRIVMVSGITLFILGGLLGLPPSEKEIAQALTLPEGATQVGTINDAPVVKSPTDNMSSDTFQNIVAAMLEGAGNPSYIINQAAWGSSTTLANGKPLSSISTSATQILGADGFVGSDLAVELPIGGRAVIPNVGTAIKTDDGTLVPISLGITVNNAVDPDGVAYDTVVMGAKSQSSVITLGWGSIVRGGSNTGGGQTEGGGIGGESSDGTLMGYIDSITYTLTFLNSGTGQPLPVNDTLMPIKNSDIDANQLATMDSKGALGYILSPDTALTQVGNGFRSTSDGAVNEDSSDLTENSYVVLKKYNSNTVQYNYMDGAGNHLDIVSGHFGNTPFKVSELLGGFLEINKTVLGFGNKPWNSNYSFDKLLFDVVDKDGKVLDTMKLDKTGNAKSKRIMKGNYKVVERSTGWSAIGQTVRANESTIIKTGETTTLNLENKPVLGESTLQKTDKDTGTAQNGKADLTESIFQLVYKDTSTGSSPHKAGDPVKWTDQPNPKLLLGEKVTSALVGGQTVDYGDSVVVKVDKESLKLTVGNLALGDYAWKEIDVNQGYTVDGISHDFSLTYKDEKTETVVADEITVKNRAIDAAIKINKMATLPESQGGSGINDIEFTASPMEGTVADPVKLVTGVDPVSGDDGYATANLVYGDWKIEETKGLEGYKDIKPIYIHMETNRETDVLTITASYYADFSKPFSKRTFALQDSSTEKNPNSQGTVGSVTTDKPTISLSTLHFNDNPEEETPPTPPTKDVTKEDNGESINEGNVALDSDFFYVLNSSVLQPNRKDTVSWTINDDYDENFDRYNGWFKVYATTDFDKYKAGDELPNEWIKAEDKDGKVLFTVQKELKDLALKQTLLDVVNLHKDKPVGFSIHASFYRYKASDKVVNTFVETINDVKQDSNEVFTKTPKPEPHKFNLSKEQVDLTGDALLKDDEEMKDRYEDTNSDPYNDKTDNNSKENNNTNVVKAGDTIVYQLWLDTRPFDATSKLNYLRMVDPYDKDALTVDTSKVKVYNEKGEAVTDSFKVEDKDGVLTISANVFKKAKNSKGEEISIVDTEKIPFGAFYKIDAPMTVKDSIKAGTDIINTADQQWQDADGTADHHITEKRVNKTPDPKETPVEKVVKGVLPNTGDKPGMFILKVIGWLVVLAVIVYAVKRIKNKKAAEVMDSPEQPF